MRKQLLLESIRIDNDTQCRERINEDTVADYAEGMKAETGLPFPPLTVFFDGTEYWLADGFHRLLAARRIGRKNILADVEMGSKADAAWAACAANQTHGLRRTNQDKRKAVAVALKLHPDRSDRALGLHCGVSDHFVGDVRRQVRSVRTSDSENPNKPATLPPPPVAPRRVGADGKSYPVPPPQRERPSTPPPSRPAMLTPPAKPPEARAPSGPTDDVGRVIPDALQELWGRRQEVQDMLTALSRVRCALKDAQEKRDPLFSEVSFSSALTHLDHAYDLVQVAKPYAVCAMCQGHGCKVCGQRGLLGKFRWDTAVPAEVKKEIERLVKKAAGN